MDLFKKSIVVGVSVTPEVGLEVAQIDFANKTVLKYGLRPLEYDINRREIADLDIFKEALQDLFLELQIPKNSEVVLNLPSVIFNVILEIVIPLPSNVPAKVVIGVNDSTLVKSKSLDN